MIKWIFIILILVIAAVNFKGCDPQGPDTGKEAVPAAIYHEGPLPVLAQNAGAAAEEPAYEVRKPQEYIETGTDDLEQVSEEERQLTEIMTD